MICPNTTSPEWKALVNKIGENNAWKEFLIYKTIPNANNYEQISPENVVPIKSGVAELFESSPELANAVYEAAGFNNNVVFETERGSVYYLNNGKTKRDKKTLTGRIEKFSESDKTVYITEKDFKILRENSEGLKDLEWSDDSVSVTNDSNRKTTISVKSNPEIGLIPLELVKGVEETETGYREDKRINIKSYSFLPNGVSFHAGHKIVSINSQITPRQKQQAQQLYSQYLDTIFPDSKVKDIVYHGTDFNKDNVNFKTDRGGIFLASTSIYASYFSEQENAYPALINFNNIYQAKGLTDNIGKEEISQIKAKGFDSVVGKGGISKMQQHKNDLEYIAFEPEQIHILGSKQDVEGFKEFVANQQKTTAIPVLRSIRTRSTEDIAKGIDVSMIRSKEELKYTTHIMANLLHFLGDLAPNQPLSKTPTESFNVIKERYSKIDNSLKFVLNGFVKNDADLAALKGSPNLGTLIENYNQLAVIKYINNYDDLIKASEAYDNIIKNFERFKEQVTAELLRKGIRIKENKVDEVSSQEVSNQNEDDTEDSSLSAEEKGERFDKDMFEMSIRDSASMRVRALVQTIKTGEYEMGMPIYANPEDVFADMLHAGSEMELSGADNIYSKLDAFRGALQKRKNVRPYLADLLNKINEYEAKNEWHKINDILTFATKAFAQETLLLYKTRKIGNQVTSIHSLKVINSNRDTVEDQVSREFLELHKQSDFYSKNSVGELKPNSEKIEKLRKIVEAGRDGNSDVKMSKFREFFTILGIPLNDKELKHITDNIGKALYFNGNFNTVFVKGKMLDNIITSFEKNKDVVFEDNYGFQDEKTSMRAMAGLYYEANPDRYRIVASKTADGKSKYLYILTNFIEKMKRRWNLSKTAGPITDTALGKPNTSFWEKVKSGVFTFVPQYFNGIREQEAGKDGKVRKSLTDKEQIVTMMLKHQENMNTGTYINFTLSDKTTTLETKITKEFMVDTDATPMGLGVDYSINNNNVVYSDSLKLRVYNTFAEPEVSRIFSAIKYSESIKVENYDIAGRLFYILPELNSDPRLETFRKDLYEGNKSLEEIKDTHALTVGNVIMDMMTSSIKTQTQQLIKYGIIKVDDKNNYLFPTTDVKYLARLKQTKLKNQQLTEVMLMDLKLNYMNSQVKMIQFLKFDPSVAYKAFKGFKRPLTFDEVTPEQRVKLALSTWDEFSKRAAALIAPGLQGNFTWTEVGKTGKGENVVYSKPTYRAVTVNDVEYKINGIKNTTTDAQEFVTMQEHIDVLMSEGKMPIEIWQSVTNKIREAGPGGYYELSPNELKYVFTPTKPVHVNDSQEGPSEAGINRIDYIKSSRYPLIPQHEVGSQRDELRKWMEINNIQAANFASGKKLGRPGISVKLFENDGTFVTPDQNILDAAVQELSRSGLRTQQEIPHQKDEIRVVTQMNRTLFDNMLNERFSLKGVNDMSGFDAKRLKERVRSRLFDIEAAKLDDELGDLNKDHRNLHRLLRDTILSDSTGSYGENDLKALELDPLTNKFKKPLELMFKTEKFQGLINSLINKNVMLKIEGSSFVQVSGVGARYKFSDLGQGVKSDVIWLDDYAKQFENGGEATLKYISKKDGVVQPAQVLVSQYLRDNEGNLIDLSKFITEVDGKKILDTSKFTPDMFQLVGTRIPNQSHPSMLPIEVVGFLPSYMENTIVVPDGITGQMGSDFDVDKLYAYFSKTDYSYENPETIEAVQNEISTLIDSLTNTYDQIKAIRIKGKKGWPIASEVISKLKEDKKTLAEKAKTLDKKKKSAIYRQIRKINSEIEAAYDVLKDIINDQEISKGLVAQVDQIKSQIKDKKAELKNLTAPDKIAAVSSLSYDLNSFSDIDNLNKEQLEQLYRDIHWMALTHPAAYDKITKSIDMPEVGDKVEERDALLKKYLIPVSKGSTLPLDFMTSIKRYNDNRSGKIGVSVFANFISAQADLQDKSVSLGYINEGGEVIQSPLFIRAKRGDAKPLELLYLGKPAKSESFVEDENGNKIKREVSENLNMMFTESVDNAKNQNLREFNWEEKAMSPVGALSMLSDKNGNAIPIEFCMELTSQRAIANLFEMIDQKRDSFGEYDSKALDNSIDQLTDLITSKLVQTGRFTEQSLALEYLTKTERDNVLDPQTLRDMWLVGQADMMDPGPREATLEKIAEDYGYANVNELMVKFYTTQFDSLQLFKRIDGIGRELMTVLTSAYTYTKGIGPNVFATKQKINQLEKFNKSSVFLGLDSIIGEFKTNDSSNSHTVIGEGEIGSSIKNSLLVAERMYKSIFPISSGETIKELVNVLLERQGKTKDQLGKDAYINLYRTVFNGIKSYMYTNPELELFLDAKSERNRLINGKTSIGSRILELYTDPEMKNNGFLKNIEVRQAPKQEAFTLNFKAPFGSDLDEKAILSGFYQLATSEKEEVRQLAKDLAIYPFLTGDAGNIGRFIPDDYLMADEDFSKAIGNIHNSFITTVGDIPEFANVLLEQIVQNNADEFSTKFQFASYMGPFGSTDSAFKKVFKKNLNGKETLKDVTTFTFKLGDFLADEKGSSLANALRKPLTSADSFYMTKAGISITTDSFSYPSYLLLTDTVVSETFPEANVSTNYLYKKVSVPNMDGTVTYQRINILGYNGIKEYGFNMSGLTSAIKNNNNVEDDVAFQETVPPAVPLQEQVTSTGSNNPAEFTNHSGGAALSDTEWDQIGREFGVINHKHYREPLEYIDTKGQPAKGSETVDSKKLQVAGIKPEYISQEDYNEGAQKATQAFRMMFTDAGNKSVRSAYIIRNWMQVKNADAVYALGTIKQPGENASDKAGETRIAAVPIVKGGTGYAVQMAINERKPVYVFDATKEGWYKYDYNVKNFVPTETPKLTRNFAGIGSRSLSTQEVIDKSLQAIRDVYTNTFVQAQPAITGIKTYTGKIESLEPNQVFVFGSNPLGINGNPEKYPGMSASVATKNGWVQQGEKMDNRLSDSGKAWGLTTVTGPGKQKSMSPEQIQAGIAKLYEHAKANPSKEFLVAYSAGARNNNGYTAQEMADMFSSVEIPSNIVFEEGFGKLLKSIKTPPTTTMVEISSDSKGLAAALTNRTQLAKEKGNLTQLYPVRFNEVDYRDAEAAYQNNKNKYSKDGMGKGTTYDLMVQILEAKLRQHPRLVTAIDKEGGKGWLEKATHQPTTKNTVWETGGGNYFIKALVEAYENVKKPVEENEGDQVANVREVEYKGTKFVIEQISSGGLKFYYQKNDGTKGAEVKDRSLVDKLFITDIAFLNPQIVVTITVNSEDQKYLVFKNSIFSLQPSTFGNIITSPVVTKLVLDEFYKKIQDKEPRKNIQDSSSKTFFEYNGIKVQTEFQLSQEQSDALKKLIDFTESRSSSNDIYDGTYTLEGYAGTGKTSIIGVLDRYMQQKSKGVTKFIYMAPTHAATVALGVNIVKYGATELPMTVTSAITESQDPKNPGPKFTLKFNTRATGVRNIIVLDEASMLANADFDKLIAAAKREGFKVIFMGDPKQIPEVMVNASSKPLAKAFNNPNISVLTSVFRTKEKGILDVLTNIRNNSSFVEYSFESTDSFKQLKKSDYNEELLTDFQNNLEDVTVINYTNEGVAKANKQARAILGFQGPLQVGEKIVGYAGSQTKQIEKGHLANSVSYIIKDIVKQDDGRVVITAKSKSLEDLQKAGMSGFPNASSFTYLQLSSDDSLNFDLTPEQMRNNMELLRNRLRVIHDLNEKYKNKSIMYRAYVEAVGAERAALANINTGARYIYNPKIDMVEKYDANKHRGINANLEMDKGVDFGYAITIHKSQGMTIPIVYFDTQSLSVVRDTSITRNGEKFNSEKNALYYVGMSRASKKLVVPNAEPIITSFDDINSYFNEDDDFNADFSFDQLEMMALAQIEEERNRIIKDIFKDKTTITDANSFLNDLYKIVSPQYKNILLAIGRSGKVNGLTIKLDESLQDPGIYNPSTRTIIINPKLATGNSGVTGIKDEIIEVIMHELMHHVTVDLLSADSNTLTAEQRKWVKAINNLFEYAQNKVMEDPSRRTDLLAAISQTNMEGGYLSKSEKSLYYGLTNVYDFVSMLITDKGFQEFMNEMPYTETKSVLDRLLDILTNLLKTFGISVKDDSVLREGVENIIGLISSRVSTDNANSIAADIQRSISTNEKYLSDNFEDLLNSLNIKTVC